VVRSGRIGIEIMNVVPADITLHIADSWWYEKSYVVEGPINGHFVGDA